LTFQMELSQLKALPIFLRQSRRGPMAFIAAL